MPPRIVSLAARPDLLDTVALWQWEEWSRKRGVTLAAMRADLAPLTDAAHAEACFVALDGAQPVGTASLTLADLDARPDLSPWLASVVVLPEHRKRGYATRLVRAVEREAVARGIATLWLFTWTTTALYAGLGWHAVGQEPHGDGPVTLMRRDLAAAPPPVADGR